MAEDCYHKCEIFKVDFKNDLAVYYLELRAELDTTNGTWELSAGLFIDHFENNIGAQFELKYVGKKEKGRITEAYNKWKN